MAGSPSHRFGQLIGDLLEEIMTPAFQEFCIQRELYLDVKGERGDARAGRKVTWEDKFGNTHDLDFVIERGGSKKVRGRPVAFIEAAWRRYTKHSRNKVQEIQGAILPIAEKHSWDAPFLGAILAGVFTDGSLAQMRSSGFEVVLFPYESIVEAFFSIGIDVAFDEKTPDTKFASTVTKINKLPRSKRDLLKKKLVETNRLLIDQFFGRLQSRIDRRIEPVTLIALHGEESEFHNIEDAVAFIGKYEESSSQHGMFRKFEVIVKYSNGDKIDASFQAKHLAISFLKYVAAGETA